MGENIRCSGTDFRVRLKFVLFVIQSRYASVDLNTVASLPQLLCC